MMEVDGGIGFVAVVKTIGGVAAAVGVTGGTAIVVAGSVYAVGKCVQWIGDKNTE